MGLIKSDITTLRVINSNAARRLEVKEDSYVEKIIKYIPSEIVLAYTALRGFITSDSANSGTMAVNEYDINNLFLYGLIFYGCLILTPFYKYFVLKDDKLPVPLYQIIIAMLSFSVWVFALGDYFEILIEEYSSTFASIILVLFTLVVPILEKLFIKKYH